MNLLNLFEDDNSTPNPNYAEELAYQIFKVAPGLDTTGAADEVLDYAFDLAVNDLGRKRAHSLFAYDEDFDSDLVNAYLDLQMNAQAEEKKQVTELDKKTLASYAKKAANSMDTHAYHAYRHQDDSDYDKKEKRKQGIGKAVDRLAKEQGVAEQQVNEYFVKAGMPVKDVLALNLFQDFDPVEGAAAQFAEFAEEPMWQQVVRKYAPIANMLKKKLLAQKRPLTDAEAEAVEQTWYDGSDAYDDMEIEYLVDIYDQQIDTLEALLAGNLTDEEFGEGVAEADPNKFDSDVDYYAAQNAPAKPRHRGQQSPGVNPDDEAYFREIFRKNKLAQQQKEREADHNRLATGTNESKKKVNESVFLKEDRQRIYEQWNKVGQHLVEYKLTPDQIQDLFSRIEKNAPDNRTMIGRGVDKATELNTAWEDLKGKIQQSHPVKGFDDLYDKAAAKLKQATGGDEGVMQYVNKYRAFAKEHPYIQSAVYAALVAAAGLSGAGVGGAAALGLLKMTDRLLQGDKASSALYKGAKTGALAMAAHSIADYFKNPSAQIPPGTPAKLPDGTDYVVQKGDTLSQIAQKNGVSVKDLMAANSGQTVPTGDRITWNDPNAFTDINPMGDAVPAGTGSEPTYDVRTKLTNPDVLQPGQKLNVPGSLGPTQTYADGVGTAADTWDKVKSGAYTPSEISRNQAAKWNLPGAGEYNPPAGARIPADQAPMYDPTGGAASLSKPDYEKYDDGASQLKPSADMTKVNAKAGDVAQKGDEVDYASSKTNPRDAAHAKVDADVAKSSADYSKLLAQNPDAPVAYDQDGNLMPGWKDDPEKPGFVKFNAPKLKESQIYSLFDSVVTGHKKLNEGVWDSVKGAAGKAADWAKTKGHNLTTKVTLDKLLTAWNKLGKPTDSEQIRKILQNAGVNDQVIASVYSSMRIPVGATSAPVQQPDVYGRQEPSMSTPAARATPVATTQKAPAAAPAKSAATPAWADPKSAEYVGRREVARRMAAQPAPAAKPAAPAMPQWSAGTGAYSTQTAKQQPGSKPVAAPAGTKVIAGGPTPAERQALDKRIAAAAQQPVEENKKDDEAEPNVKDVVLQRAISRAKADFPTAGSGIEALAKDFMRSQDQDQKAFDQLRQAERKQDQMLGQIAKIDQEQEQEIQDIENQNSTLSSRLQQLQNVNGELEKKLAAMSGRKEKRKADQEQTKATAEPAATVNVKAPKDATPAKEKPKAKTAKAPEPIAAKTKSKVTQPITSKAIDQVAQTLTPADNAISRMVPQLEPRQKELGFDEPVTLNTKKYDTSKATDVPFRTGADIAKDVKANMASQAAQMVSHDPEGVKSVLRQKEMPLENQESDRPEAEYSNKYQDMVKRMGQKAREQEKSKPVDIADLARRLAAIEASHKDK